MHRVFKAALAAAAWTLPVVAAAQDIDPKWSRMTEIYTRNDNTYLRGEFFSNNHYEFSRPTGCRAGNWCTMNVADYGISTDAKAVLMSGILIVTVGTTHETANLFITCRAFGDTENAANLPTYGGAWYNGQIVGHLPGANIRSPYAVWCPVKDGKWQMTYSITTPGTWPTNTAYGVNMSIQAWGR
jgi:hypothetical protein